MSHLLGKTDSTLRNMCKVNEWDIESDNEPMVLAKLKQCNAVARQAKAVGEYVQHLVWAPSSHGLAGHSLTSFPLCSTHPDA